MSAVTVILPDCVLTPEVIQALRPVRLTVPEPVAVMGPLTVMQLAVAEPLTVRLPARAMLPRVRLFEPGRMTLSDVAEPSFRSVRVVLVLNCSRPVALPPASVRFEEPRPVTTRPLLAVSLTVTIEERVMVCPARLELN